MINGRTVIALVPARGGSKGVPRKNLHKIQGKSLLQWTYEAAVKSQFIDKIYMSTEDAEIEAEARHLGFEIPFRRPEELAQDTSAGMDVVLHFLDEVKEGEILVLLQPTSPLRNSDDIDSSIEKFVNSTSPSLVSVCKPAKPPQWIMTQNKETQAYEPITGWDSFYKRRQDLPEAFAINGAVYVSTRDFLKENKSFYTESVDLYEMPSERSFDIDNPIDLEICEILLKNMNEGDS